MAMSPETINADAQRPDVLRPFRYALRTPGLLLHLLVGLPITLLLINPLSERLRWKGERLDHLAIRSWSLGLMWIFGFRVRRIGKPVAGGALMVANHVSWIDIVLVHSQCAVGFVAKSEISRWPLIGWLARRGGTIYHQRGNNESLHGVMHQMVERLQAGLPVGVFPEGGTTDGQTVRTFHARIFQPAVTAVVPVQAVALRYGAGGNAQMHVAFGQGESFVANFLRLLGDPSRVAEVHFLPPIEALEEGRRKLAEAARTAILGVMQP